MTNREKILRHTDLCDQLVRMQDRIDTGDFILCLGNGVDNGSCILELLTGSVMRCRAVIPAKVGYSGKCHECIAKWLNEEVEPNGWK